ncbi:MAG: bis(5'-nucleosyl)-tetraphosphatase (symmetrical) YqeK [Lachnospiraceae bacterium]|nr:bis(5'-nucleosyl)-tetraphosphatase (symmetrical) YqeK [Lachnospiraceae bacterium]
MENIDNKININHCRTNDNLQLFLKYNEEVKNVLKDDEDRYWHSVSVSLTAQNLADVYGANKDDCMVAGILHDYCKCMSINEMLLMCEKYNVELSDEDKQADGCIHGFLAAKICKDKFNINDEVYNAIYYHTCGRPNMTILEKIIYISDFIEPLRRFRDRVEEVRKMAYINIDKAVVLSSEMGLKHLKATNKFIHSNTQKTIEYYKKLIN